MSDLVQNGGGEGFTVHIFSDESSRLLADEPSKGTMSCAAEIFCRQDIGVADLFHVRRW